MTDKANKVHTENVPCERCRQRTDEITSGGRYEVLSCTKKSDNPCICELRYTRKRRS
ncbi:hypothetical protein [Pseudoalteromonas obscura]|uniref:hypothetical protein n=1 Tax=Pseudoalteromonas obscura TaxID=3048491 RepID=UPI0024DE7DD4|nr:hypothetical protein [Pseudoalteromonas sp. P94(2023)]